MDFNKKQATVYVDPTKFDEKKLLAALSEKGFEAEIVNK
ncbi:MAG: hypothetical protein KatS3mg105_4023 [Gemmatales bacterium]|nr:MAG: hypothetical protein KatS3mg105_4023 [Gemmatales bacterium]